MGIVVRLWANDGVAAIRVSKPTSPAYCIAAIIFTCVFERPCGALRSADWSSMVTMTATGCEVVHRRKNLLELRTERQAGVSGISRNEATGFVSGAVL